MNNSTTTAPEHEQQANELNAPWSLHFDCDGTEEFGIICDGNGNDLVASHLPSTRLGDKTIRTGTFWLPEKADEAMPLRVRQMQVMVAAPRLLQALESIIRITELREGNKHRPGGLFELLRDVEGTVRAAIAEAKGLAA